MPTDPPSDATLLAAAQGGDRRALEALLDRHQAQIYRFGMKMCRDAEDAQDILQETLLAMARGIGDFRGASSLATWLYAIARSACIKKRRRSKFAPDETSLDAAGAEETRALRDPARLPDDVLAGKQVEAALNQVLSELDPLYREVLVLRDGEGLTAPEVAEVLGITVQAVKSRLHRARLAVREGLAPVLDLPTDTPAAPEACPDVLTLFSQHLEDEISAEVCMAMERHLEGCPRCRNACDSLKQTLSLCRTSGTKTDVPAPVQAAVKQALRSFLREGP